MNEAEGTPTDMERFLWEELRFSRSTYVPWGKEIVRALDFDDCLRLVEVFEVKAQLGAHVDVQVTANNYGGYIWTAWLHKLQGDTALHMAIRQKKLMCTYMLLAMGAATDIENRSGQTAEELCLKKLKRDVRDLKKEAFRQLIPQIDPRRFVELPKSTPGANYRTIAQEATALIYDGRTLYSELPKCFSYDDIIPDPKGAARPPKGRWVIRYDQNSKRQYKYNEWTGEIIWMDRPKKANEFGLAEIEFKELIVEDKWSIRFDEEGNKYYLNETTGESTWEMPESFKSKRAKAKADADAEAEESDYEIAEEDEEAQMRLLKRQREAEEQEKSQAEAKRKAASEEKERLKREEELLERRKIGNESRKAQRDKERLTGLSNTPGGWAVGDVWARNGFTDVLRLIQRQRARQDKEDEAERHRQSGLTLLSAANASDRPGVSRDLLKGLDELKGYKKLKFMKMRQLRSLAIEWENNVDPRGDLELPIRYVTRLSSRTNMKGMSIGNIGFIRIFKALVGDRIIQEIILPGIGLSDIATKELTLNTMPAMKSIRILDLSQNAIEDEGATFLAEAILNTPTLVKMTVAANRITIEGAKPLCKAVIDERCSLSFFSLCKNHIRPAEREQLISIVNPFHVSGLQNRFRPKFFIGPGGRKTIYPFTFTPFKKSPPPLPQTQSADQQGKKESHKEKFTHSGILSNSPMRLARPSSPESPGNENAQKGVSFGINGLGSKEMAHIADGDEAFESFVYQGQGIEGRPGAPSVRGLHVYL